MVTFSLSWASILEAIKLVRGTQNFKDWHDEQRQGHDKNREDFNTFATRRFPGGDVEDLGGHSHGPLHGQPLVLRSPHQIRTNYTTKNRSEREKMEEKTKEPNRSEARTLLEILDVLGG